TQCYSLRFDSSFHLPELHSFPTRRSSDLARSVCRPHAASAGERKASEHHGPLRATLRNRRRRGLPGLSGHLRLRAVVRARAGSRSEEHTSELQSLRHLVCRLLLEKKKSTQ